MDGEIQVGRVLRSSTSAFTVGCRQLIAEQDRMIPQLGALLKAAGRDDDAVYGFICNVTIEDDTFVRQLVAAGTDRPEMIEDQRQMRQVPVVVDVLTAGFCGGGVMYQRLPPQPPRTLEPIYTCTAAELRRFTDTNDWLRLLLPARDFPADQVIVAALLAAAGSRPSAFEREAYLIGAGRDLARLLSLDLVRLDGILTQLRPGTRSF